MKNKNSFGVQFRLSGVVLTTTLWLISSVTYSAPILTMPRNPLGKSFTGVQKACDLAVGTLPPAAKLDATAQAYLNTAPSMATPMWAQEAIGGPESLQFMIAFEKANPQLKLKWVPVGISDGAFSLKDLPPEKLNNELKRQLASASNSSTTANRVALAEKPADKAEHSYSVASLISDMDGFGTGYRSYLSWFNDTISGSKQTSSFAKAEVKPWFVNRSIESLTYPFLDLDSETVALSKESVVVAAAGNSFPWPTDKGGYPAIVVGAVDQFGIMASFSRQGSAVDVTAPGAAVLVYSGKNKLSLVNGTSFAAPLVTGVLSSVSSILPGITLNELREMIKKTAIQTVAYTSPTSGDGAGVINQYAMIRVAGRLANNWPANRNQIHVASSYDFRSEIAERKAAIAKHPPVQSAACAVQKNILLYARQNFFLDPSDLETREALSKLYFFSGYYSQATYYDAPQKNATVPWIAQRLNVRRFGVAVSLGDTDTLRALSNVRIQSNQRLADLFLLAAARGDTASLRFMAEGWYMPGINKELRDTMYDYAFRGNHQAALRYISSIVPTP